MNKVVSKRQFSENVVGLDIEAPRIAKARKAGHFVMVRVDEKGERIPLTISSADVQRGTITLVIQKVGVSSRKLTALEPGDMVHDLVGPLGHATEVKKYGSVLCRSEEHTSELQSRPHLVCRLLLEKQKHYR